MLCVCCCFFPSSEESGYNQHRASRQVGFHARLSEPWVMVDLLLQSRITWMHTGSAVASVIFIRVHKRTCVSGSIVTLSLEKVLKLLALEKQNCFFFSIRHLSRNKGTSVKQCKCFFSTCPRSTSEGKVVSSVLLLIGWA